MASEKKRMKKQKTKVATRRKVATKSTKNELVIRVEQAPVIPTVSDLSEPMREDGKKLTIPKTWLSDKQILQMVQRTPKEHVYRRAGKGGKSFDYITGSYVTKVLNFVFGWNWDFEVVEQGKEGNQIWVKGRLTIHGNGQGQQIVKTQYGRADIKMLKAGGMVDYGNDLKAAATDAMKKCASLLGIGSDIYGKMEYKEETNRDPQDNNLPAITPGAPTPEGPKPGQVLGPDGQYVWLCSDTDEPISEQDYTFSMKMYGKPLSRAAQANHKAKK